MSALDGLFWRDEILQALFWMHGEDLAEQITASELARFLNADEAVIGAELAHLAEEGYVEQGDRVQDFGSSPASYRLTPLGTAEGGRRFRDEFDGLTRQAHGECGPGCWCHDPEREGEPCPSQPKPEPERVGA